MTVCAPPIWPTFNPCGTMWDDKHQKNVAHSQKKWSIQKLLSSSSWRRFQSGKFMPTRAFNNNWPQWRSLQKTFFVSPSQKITVFFPIEAVKKLKSCKKVNWARVIRKYFNCLLLSKLDFRDLKLKIDEEYLIYRSSKMRKKTQNSSSFQS